MTAAPYQVGQWLPSDQQHLETWLQRVVAEAHKQFPPLQAEVLDANAKESLDVLFDRHLHPVLQDFKLLIESDATVFMLFNMMFAQVPHKPPYNKNPNQRPQIRNYHTMLAAMNVILTHAPEFLVVDGQPAGLIGFPINAILNWPMGTAAGFAAFIQPMVNECLKNVLDAWGRYLLSADSVYVLNDGPSGWFGPAAQQAMPNFAEQFVCDPSAPHYGYRSWDDFFTREFREGVRPLAAPEDDNVIANACESAPFNKVTDLKWRDHFWIKGQPYSLEHLLAGDEYAEGFVGGTLYQAFLSALSYHRWHSPVSGTIVKAYVEPGTYYSEAFMEGFANPDGPDDSAPNGSQGYIAQMAARAFIYIEADNPDIGLMCFVAIGMAEVSTCDIRVYEGQHISKGEQLGMFHFGGSTHCLLFRPGVELDFDFHGQKPGLESHNIPVRSRIATVVKR
ncbi:phosphatidylserine decarboxylase family protein [Pokkaliibacter sp. CJK22405]|uniref:phosphatidylserine decarboxylase family protein n=1 Tax=Pokkaliibacter sp. CJK22405 TaxID=3384615 RepID=UPI0039850C47